jgi:hypothetical protein
MNSRKLIFWITMLAVAAAITSFLFYIDDWEETHAPGYESTDTVGLIIGVFSFYTLIITAVLGGLFYAVLRHWLNKSPAKKLNT